MEIKSRETFLKIGVGVVVGLFLLDRMVLSPAISGWKSQSERPTAPQKGGAARPVIASRGKPRSGALGEMQGGDLPDDLSASEDEVWKRSAAGPSIAG